MQIPRLLSKAGLPALAALVAAGLSVAVVQTYVVITEKKGPGDFTPVSLPGAAAEPGAGQADGPTATTSTTAAATSTTQPSAPTATTAAVRATRATTSPTAARPSSSTTSTTIDDHGGGSGSGKGRDPNKPPDD
ncbi:MAG TPA: hypothetical protein VGO92_11105 [Acidimicrobiales bacterium]|nr:hypothetical protein [Acidimicrobiales bacterium]